MATILIADDSLTSRKAIASVLEPRGHKIIFAADGNEAWSKITMDKPDIVVLDIVMPNMGGFEIARQIRNTDGISNTGIIILTALKTATNKYWGLKQGADFYLTKPAHPKELIKCIDSLTENRI